MPLKGASGRTFGVLLSVAPALPDPFVQVSQSVRQAASQSGSQSVCQAGSTPDPFVQVMCRAAGPALERAWKRERAERLLQSACEWLTRLGRAQGAKLVAS